MNANIGDFIVVGKVPQMCKDAFGVKRGMVGVVIQYDTRSKEDATQVLVKFHKKINDPTNTLYLYEDELAKVGTIE